MSTRRASGRKGSSGLSFSAFAGSLEKGLTPVYAFLGRDTFLKMSCVRYVCEAAGGKDEPCSPVEFDGEQCDPRLVFDELRTLPLLDDWRIVCVDKANKFLENCPDSVESLPRAGKRSVLILTDVKLDKRRKLAKEIYSTGVVVNCDEMSESDLARWLTKRIAESGKKAPTAAIRRMVERVGPSPAALDQAVEQLITYTGTQAQITPEDVAEAIPAATAEEVWSLTDGLAARDGAKSMAVVDDLVAHGEPVQKIVGAFAWHVKRLLTAKYMIENGTRESEVFKELRVYGSRANRFRSQLANFTLDEAKKTLSLLKEADVQLKRSGSSRDRLILERTVLELCS